MSQTTTRRLFDADQDTITVDAVTLQVAGESQARPIEAVGWATYALGEPGTLESGGTTYSYRDITFTALGDAPAAPVEVRVAFTDGEAEAGGSFLWDLTQLTSDDVANASSIAGPTVTAALEALKGVTGKGGELDQEQVRRVMLAYLATVPGSGLTLSEAEDGSTLLFGLGDLGAESIGYTYTEEREDPEEDIAITTVAGMLAYLLENGGGGGGSAIRFGSGEPPAGEGEIGDVWIDAEHQDAPMYERAEGDGGAEWVRRVYLTAIDEERLFNILPIAPSLGWGSLAVGPNERQRGTAHGNGTVSLGRQPDLYADYSIGMGRRVRSLVEAAFSVVMGDDALASRRFEFAHGVAPGDNRLVYQRSWIQHSGVTRGAGPERIRDSGGGTAFNAIEGQRYTVTARVNAATASGAKTAEYVLQFIAKYAHGGGLMVTGTSKTTIHTDDSSWDVYPEAYTPVTGNQTVEFMWTGNAGEQVLVDVHIDWHETTLPGAVPAVPTITSSTDEGGEVTFTLDAPAEQPAFEGYAEKLVIFRGTSPGDLPFFATPDAATETWTDEGSNFGGSPPESGTDYYYQFAYANLAGIWSPKTEVFGPLSV